MRRPRPHSGVVLASMDVQAEIRELRRRTAPLYEAAMATGNYELVSEAKFLDMTLRAVATQARRLAGMAEALVACPDGEVSPGHGRAA